MENFMTKIIISNTFIIFFLSHISKYTYYITECNQFIQYLGLSIFILYIVIYFYKKYINKIKNKIQLTLTYVII